jgi:hypothetical protein
MNDQRTYCFEMSQSGFTEEIQVFISKTVSYRRWVARLVAYRSCLVRLLSVLNPEAVFKEKREVWNLSHSRLRSQLSVCW